MVPPIQRHLGLTREAATERAIELLAQVGTSGSGRADQRVPA